MIRSKSTCDRPLLCVVHCVDTEGPLHESLEASFERVAKILKRPDVREWGDTLEELVRGQRVPPEFRQTIRALLDRRMMAYNEDWTKLDEMLGELMSRKWRERRQDDFGNPYLFSWFVMDHVGFTHNPRRRAMGYHAIFEHYLEWLARSSGVNDAIYWHYHPVAFDYQGHKCSCNFSFTNHHLEVLSRRVIDHLYFPSAFRPAQHTERPDINLFLEQWVPFDYGNQACDLEDNSLASDITDGRFGDWRRAPRKWGHYHPDIVDYQISGEMHRYVYRCLNVGSRLRHIRTSDVGEAFVQAKERGIAVLSVANHDFRDMRPDVDAFIAMIQEARTAHPEVAIAYTTAVDAARLESGLRPSTPVRMHFSLADQTISLTASSCPWGSQPYLAVKTKDGRYLHENFDYHGGLKWAYTFDELTIPLSSVDYLGVAANDQAGQTSVYRLALHGQKLEVEERFWNLWNTESELLKSDFKTLAAGFQPV